MKHRGVISSLISAWGFALLAALSAAPSTYAQTATVYNEEGVRHYEAKQWKNAIVSFKQAYELDPKNDVVRQNLSNALQARAGELAKGNQYDDAVKQLKEAIAIEANNAEPLIQMGAYYLIEGRVQDAIFRLEEAIEISPDNIEGHFLLGEAYYKDNDVSSALDHWRWVNEMKPDLPGLQDRLETATTDERVEAHFRPYTRSRNFNIRYSREVKTKTLHYAARVLDDAYRDIGYELGGARPPTPIAVTLYTVESFSEATQLGEHVGALYDGARIRCPVVDSNGVAFPDDEIRRRLLHEYVHVVVRHIAKDSVPWWFNEGLAETLSRKQTDRERTFLGKAWSNESGFALEELHDEQLEKLDIEHLKLAYIQSHATVEFLQRRYGTRRLGQLLRTYSEGENPEAALRGVCSYTYRSLEKAVADSLPE